MKNDEEFENENGEMGEPRYESILFRFLARFFPGLLFHIGARLQGINTDMFKKLHRCFSQSKRIDIFPTSGLRGFIITVDREASFFFDQDGDHFSYDGFEIGKYGKGDVTVFDDLPNKSKE